MKKCLCKITTIAMVLCLMLSVVAYAADYNPKEALKGIMFGESWIYVEDVQCHGAMYTYYGEFYSVYQKCQKLIYDENATDEECEQALQELINATSRLQRISPIETTETFDINKLPEIFADGKKIYPEVSYYDDVYEGRFHSKADGIITIWSGGSMETFRRIYDENKNLLISNDDLGAPKDPEGYGCLSFDVEAGKTYVIAVGMYETHVVPEKICIWVDFKESYLTTEPTTEVIETTEPTDATVPIEIVAPAKAKKANPVKVTTTVKTLKAKALKNKSVTYKAITVKKAKGKVTFEKISGNKKLSVNKSNGKITVKKGIKAGRYTVKIKITVKGNFEYKPKTVTKKVTVKIK